MNGRWIKKIHLNMLQLGTVELEFDILKTMILKK